VPGTTTVTSTQTSTITNSGVYAVPSSFYLLTQPINAYIAANVGGYDLVLSSTSTTSYSPLENANNNNFDCPDCPNALPPGLAPAVPATLFELNTTSGTLTIADVPGEAYAGYALSDFNDDEDFYQQDLFGPERPQAGEAEYCDITCGGLLECNWNGGQGDMDVVWAVCYGGAVFRGSLQGLAEYEAEMARWVRQGQGHSPACQVVDVQVVPA